MFGRIKLAAGRVVALAEKVTTPPATLPAHIMASRVALVGASVADFWNVKVRYPFVDVVTLYSHDKTPAIESLLGEARRPDTIVIKECAAYFPLPLEKLKPLVTSWLETIGDAGVQSILATVVPVTRRHATRHPGRQEGIIEYNDWVRKVSVERHLSLLDLANALNSGPSDLHLDERLATRDGLHLKRIAYRQRLDPILGPAIIEAMK